MSYDVEIVVKKKATPRKRVTVKKTVVVEGVDTGVVKAVKKPIVRKAVVKKDVILKTTVKKDEFLAEEAEVLDNGTQIKKPRVAHSYTMDFGMAFVTKDNVQVAQMVSCRDWMHDQIRTEINKKRVNRDAHPYYPESGDPPICLDEARVLFVIRKDYPLDRFIDGMKILNNMETFAGVQKSVAEIVTYTTKPIDNAVMLLVTGDKCYMDVPHLLSIMTLVLRFTTCNPAFEYKKIGDLSTAFLKMVANNEVEKDRYLMKETHALMHLILKDRVNLFGNKTPQELYPIGIQYDFHGKGGINELCLQYSPNADVNDKIGELKLSLEKELKDAAEKDV